MGELKVIREKTRGKLFITEHSQYNDIDADEVEIAANITARLYGNVGNIILNTGARMYLHGVITGNVVNEGGEIHVFNR